MSSWFGFGTSQTQPNLAASASDIIVKNAEIFIPAVNQNPLLADSLSTSVTTNAQKILDKDCAQCEKFKDKLLKNSAMIRFMMQNLEKVGCPLTKKHLICTPCDKDRAGGFAPEIGLIHAFDHCTTNVNWKSPEQHACAEIRAVNLSGECRATREFRRGNFQIAKHHQACVRRRAILGVKMLPGCETGSVAEDAVRVVWDSCFNDTTPFDEIP
ncbi:Mitochondrial inner membrane protease atp23 [Physocladia obscura]|uniref:Mitochondrial inner membrane protease ATP23 n=1 Tax=Physocladia obscura TaxID=109957 RepID=A0AAD5TCY0_9FUNG|nr:Mitochondrial inner membrane protease atp23 [Physocladia obscura]